jgi:chaperonin GroES
VTTLEPLGDRVIIEPAEAADQTPSGLFVPDTAKQPPREGKVVAVGEGRRLDNGTLIAPRVKVGDTVAFPAYSFSSVTVEGKTHWIVEGKDILVRITQIDAFEPTQGVPV